MQIFIYLVVGIVLLTLNLMISGDESVKVVYSEYIDDNLMRVKNLLALHGVMVCFAAGASLIQRTTWMRNSSFVFNLDHKKILVYFKIF